MFFVCRLLDVDVGLPDELRPLADFFVLVTRSEVAFDDFLNLSRSFGGSTAFNVPEPDSNAWLWFLVLIVLRRIKSTNLVSRRAVGRSHRVLAVVNRRREVRR